MNSQQRRVKSVDEQLQKFNNKIHKLKQSITKNTILKRKNLMKGKAVDRNNAKLRELREELARIRAAAGNLEGEGSGHIAVDAVDTQQAMELDSADPPHDVQHIFLTTSSSTNGSATASQRTSAPTPHVVTTHFKAFIPNPQKWYG